MAVQPGRKSADARSLDSGGAPPRLTPPEYLNNAERALFKELVASIDSRAFVPSDAPLLVSYVQATLMARKFAGNPEQIVVWEKSVKIQATLATRLRLAPQSRLDRKTAGRQQAFRNPDPWELRPSGGKGNKHAEGQ
jgi:hypothetical protein